MNILLEENTFSVASIYKSKVARTGTNNDALSYVMNMLSGRKDGRRRKCSWKWKAPLSIHRDISNKIRRHSQFWQIKIIQLCHEPSNDLHLHLCHHQSFLSGLRWFKKKKHVVWLWLLTTSLHFVNFRRRSSPCWIKSGRLSPVRETLLLIFSLKPENKAEWYSSRSGVNWEEINDNSDGAREALDAILFGSLLQKLYFPSISVHPVCVTADPLGSRAGEKPEREILPELWIGAHMFVMQEAPLSETLGWRLAWKQITACPPCGWCLMGEMIQPGCCVIRAHAARSTFPLLNPTKISQWTSNSVTRHDHIDLHLFKTPPIFSYI